jgi:hypothetical protein
MKPIAFLGAVLILAPLAAPAQEPEVLAPRIVCPEPVFDFGEQENSGFVEHAYVIRNEGSLSLEILGVRATCGCTAVKPDDNVIPPGGETRLQARLDLRGRRGMQIKTITIQSNDPQKPNLNLQMRGTAIEGLRAQPSTLFFGRIGPDGVRSRNFDILSGLGPVRILDIRTDNPGLVVTPLDAQPGDDGTTHRYELVLADSLPAGTVNSKVTIQAELANQPREISIPVAAFIVAPSAP